MNWCCVGYGSRRKPRRTTWHNACLSLAAWPVIWPCGPADRNPCGRRFEAAPYSTLYLYEAADCGPVGCCRRPSLQRVGCDRKPIACCSACWPAPACVSARQYGFSGKMLISSRGSCESTTRSSPSLAWSQSTIDIGGLTRICGIP